MRRRRRNRATWFPVLGFETLAAAGVNGLSTVDVRETPVDPNGSPNVLIIPIIPDIDVPPEQSQTAGGNVETTLRDFVEGQSCIIERVVGNIVQEIRPAGNIASTTETIAVCAALAVIPTADNVPGQPAISAAELDPLRSDNSAQPWLWRRVWILGDQPNPSGSGAGANGTNLPGNNLYGSVAEGTKIDTKGTKRAIQREQRLFLIYSFLNMFPNAETGEFRTVRSFADLRVIGSMRKAHNRSSFK